MKLSSLTSLFDRLTVTVFDRLRDPLLLAFRAIWGWQFCVTGWGKLGNLGGTTEFFASLGIPMPGVNALFVSLLEAVGGLMLLGGFASRFIAMLLTGNMVVAYLTADRAGLSSLDAFTAATPYHFLVASLLVLAFGPGKLSIDAFLRRGKAQPAMADGAMRAQRA